VGSRESFFRERKRPGKLIGTPSGLLGERRKEERGSRKRTMKVFFDRSRTKTGKGRFSVVRGKGRKEGLPALKKLFVRASNDLMNWFQRPEGGEIRLTKGEEKGVSTGEREKKPPSEDKEKRLSLRLPKRKKSKGGKLAMATGGYHPKKLGRGKKGEGGLSVKE